MKKRYWLFIFIVLFFMISSVLIFLFKVSDSEASALFTSYLNNLYSSPIIKSTNSAHPVDLIIK